MPRAFNTQDARSNRAWGILLQKTMDNSLQLYWGFACRVPVEMEEESFWSRMEKEGPWVYTSGGNEKYFLNKEGIMLNLDVPYNGEAIDFYEWKFLDPLAMDIEALSKFSTFQSQGYTCCIKDKRGQVFPVEKVSSDANIVYNTDTGRAAFINFIEGGENYRTYSCTVGYIYVFDEIFVFFVQQNVVQNVVNEIVDEFDD